MKNVQLENTLVVLLEIDGVVVKMRDYHKKTAQKHIFWCKLTESIN